VSIFKGGLNVWNMKGRTDGECDENTPPAQFGLRGKKSQRHWAYKAHNCRNIQNDYNIRAIAEVRVSVSARISKGQGAVSAKKGNLHRSTKKIKKIRKTFFVEKAGCPLGVKGHQGAPWRGRVPCPAIPLYQRHYV
jgi:hypothetical protein